MRVLGLSMILLSQLLQRPLQADDGQIKAELDVSAAEKQCQAGDLGMCIRAGIYYEKMQQSAKAAAMYEPACLGNDRSSCLKLADLAMSKSRIEDALRWLRRECRSPKSRGEGCFRMGVYAKQSGASASAQRWFKKACTKKHQRACEKAQNRDDHD